MERQYLSRPAGGGLGLLNLREVDLFQWPAWKNRPTSSAPAGEVYVRLATVNCHREKAVDVRRCTEESLGRVLAFSYTGVENRLYWRVRYGRGTTIA